ncbi:MAG: helix-hairpin-helix domain-containing protein [Verrucomicrobiota bacterium]
MIWPDTYRQECLRYTSALPTRRARAELNEMRARSSLAGRSNGSVLIIVLWITFGLISTALYFGHSMLFEFRAADQNAAALEADQAIEGAARYVSFVLTNAANPGQLPDTNSFYCEAVPVGEAFFWLIGRGDPEEIRETPIYGLQDEASKLNLNTATREMLEMLPRMTSELAAAIIDWRDADSEVTTGGAESETYLRRNPAYNCKNANFETVEELRLVAGADLEILYGEDANLNGVLDANENDGTLSPPDDNRDGRLDPGLFEYVTVYSREPNTRSDGTPRIDVSGTQQNELATRLQEAFGQQRATQIQSRLAANPGGFGSLLQFYLRSRMTPQEFAQVAGDLSVTNAPYVEGLINVNTASAAVLACIPGIGPEKAASVAAYRQSKPDELSSVAWVTQVLDEAGAVRAGPYITTQSYQFAVDVAAVGHHGRGYRRTLFISDTSEGSPKILYRRDRARLGWALGAASRQSGLFGKEFR